MLTTQRIKACRHCQDNSLKLKPSTRMGKKWDSRDFEGGMFVEAGLSISGTAVLLGFSSTTISRVQKRENIQ